MIPRSSSPNAFTLIELLTVIAIIGILMAIIFPMVGAVRVAANKAKVKVMFSQWATAMGQFKQEYGYFPQVDSGGTANKVNPAAFIGALTTRSATTGTVLPTTDTNLCGNVRLNVYFTIADTEIDKTTTPYQLVDAFGNRDFGVIYDKDGDGLITTTDCPSGAPAVTAVGGGTFTPSPTVLPLPVVTSPSTAIRANVLFYSAGVGGSGTVKSSDAVMSWQ